MIEDNTKYMTILCIIVIINCVLFTTAVRLRGERAAPVAEDGVLQGPQVAPRLVFADKWSQHSWGRCKRNKL